MKNQITSKILKFAFAFMFILLASSCSEDNETLDAAAASPNSEQLFAKGKPVSTTFTSSITGYELDVCVDAEQTFTLSGWNGTAQLNVQIWDKVNSVWVSIDSFNGQLTSPQSLTYTFPSVDVYHLRYQVSGSSANGGTNGFVEFDVNVIDCSEGCDESFSYVDKGNNSYTFTYIPAESVSGANVIFTFAQGVNVDGLAGWNENGVTRQMEMDLVACTTYIWTVTLSPNCSGHSGNSNVWTDFKVNNNDGDTTNDSKKNGGTPNITISCPN